MIHNVQDKNASIEFTPLKARRQLSGIWWKPWTYLRRSRNAQRLKPWTWFMINQIMVIEQFELRSISLIPSATCPDDDPTTVLSTDPQTTHGRPITKAQDAHP